MLDKKHLQIGQRVVLKTDHPDGNSSLATGCFGVICSMAYRRSNDYWVPVRWDKRIERGHDCNGDCDVGHGWSVSSNDLDLVETDIDVAETDLPPISDLL